MSGVERRPSIRHGSGEGRAGALPVLLVVAALVTGCAAPTPTPTVSLSPGETPGATPGTPTPTFSPDEHAWLPGVDLPPAEPIATLSPTKEARAGVLPDTEFRLKALDGSDPVALAATLTADPPLELRVSRAGDSAIIRPAKALTEGQQYRLALAAPDGTVRASWAIQTVERLAVANTTPYDEATDVRLDTGIEVAFNQFGVDLADARQYIRVSPKVAGRFVEEGHTVAFVPDKPLEPDTIYTVTVRKGLPLAGTGMALETDQEFQFETAGGRESDIHLWLPDRLIEARPNEQAVIAMGLETWNDDGSDGTTPEAIGVAVHRLPGMAAAIDAWRAVMVQPSWAGQPRSRAVATANLPLVLDEQLPIRHRDEEDDWESFVILPTALDRGWYVVTMTVDDRPYQDVLQVTDLAVYSVTTVTRTVAWANDLATGRPVEGATAILAGARLGTTDARGIVTGKTPAAITGGEDRVPNPALEVRAGADGVFLPAADGECGKCEWGVESQPWWLVFQADRSEYRPTDTVNAWGMARSRSTGAVPATVEVRLSTYSDETGDSTPVTSRTLKTDRNGAFLAQIPLEELPYGEYRLQLRIDDEVATERDIYVTVIEKPAWYLSLGTSRRAVVSGDSVRASVQASFFEGTPVAGVELRVRGSGKARTVVTGLRGTGSVRVPLRVDGDWSQWETNYVGASPRLPEEAGITADTPVAVFMASVILQSRAVVNGERVVVTGTVHDVAFDRFDSSRERWLDDIDPYGRTRANRTVRVRVVESWTVARQTGTRYDWILRRVVPVYSYSDKERDLGTHTVRSDARGRFRTTFPATAANRSYEVRSSTTDDNSRTTIDRTYAEAPERTGDDQGTWLDSSVGEDGASVGDTVTLTYKGSTTDARNLRYLWTRAHEGLQAADVTGTAAYDFTFRASDVPGLTVNAVRFDGQRYAPVESGATVGFRLQDRDLKVTVTPDRRRYEPGGRAAITVRTTAGGRPAAASVYVGVIDEKLVAMGKVSLEDPLPWLYGETGSGIVGIAWSHAGAFGGDTSGGDTTGGDGDGESATPRSDFRDWLVARIVRTGADGTAKVSFDLSDDLTSWHAYAAGVTRSLRAGIGEASLPVALPFFAEITVAESYLVADRPIVRVRAFGSGLAADDTVTFTISSDTLPMKRVTATAKAFTAANVSLPALSVGTHRLRVDARSGTGANALRDSLVRTFVVVPTRTRQAALTSAPLEGTMRVPAGSGFTTLVIGDAGRGRVLPVLEELVSSDATRGDRALAAGIAERVLRDAFGVQPAWGGMDIDLDAFQPDGGFAVVRNSGPELDMTAIAALSGDPRLTSLDEYFASYEATTREQAIWVLAGRAATGTPVLGEVRSMAEAPDLTVREQVALAVAATAAGDETLSGTLLRQLLREAGERQGPWVRIVSTNGGDDTAVLTARLAIVAAWLGEPVAADMDAYIASSPPKTTLVDLEQAVAAQGWVRRLPAADASAALVIDGKRSVLRIKGSRPVTVVLTPAQAADATLEPRSGSVIVATRTDEPLDASSLEAPSWLEVSRAVKPSGTIGLADTVVVVLRVTRPPKATPGCLAVTELVPSGLVPVAPLESWYDDEEEGGGANPGTEEPSQVIGQRVEFCVDGHANSPAVKLRYVARVVTPGTYRWEPTLLQVSGNPGLGTVIPATKVTITTTR